MTMPDRGRVAEIMERLVSIDSINPMGRSHKRDQPVEREANDFIESLFAAHPTARCKRIAVNEQHENLLVEVDGATPGHVAVYESHVDTVPIDEWPDRALKPRWDGDTLIARGACDDKGPLAAMILALLGILESGMTPPHPIHLVCAADEEYAQLGIKNYRENAPPVLYGVFGEPTKLHPIVQHNGTMRWDITTIGQSAHTSRPELGRNAIMDMMQVIAEISRHREEWRAAHHNPLVNGPHLSVTMISGGRTRNAVPDQCTIAVDMRVLPGMEPLDERQRLIERLAQLPIKIEHSDVQLRTPPLGTSPEDPFALAVLEACRAEESSAAIRGEPYGTDASWLADKGPCVVLGPGDIAYAHGVDERIDLSEVLAGARVYQRIMLHSFA